MKFIDLNNWQRKEHYSFFNKLDYPHFNICANVDITNFYNFIKENNLPFFLSFLFVVSKTANSIDEFKLRIRENVIVQHEYIHPSFTIMTDKNLFGFCPVNFKENFNEFLIESYKKMESSKSNLTLTNEPNRDDYLFITSIPWVSFTSISHPIGMNPASSIPMVAWGKYFKENDKIKIPLSLEVHHALMDGFHIGIFFEKVQRILDNPRKNIII